MSELLKDDQKYLWHPFTQAKTDMQPLGIVKGEGALLYDQNDKVYIDAISSWWVTALGHANREISEALTEQLNQLQQVIFAGCTHPKAVALAKKLAQVVPGDLTRVFYTDNGSCAVEVAIKMCVQYFANRNEKRTKIIAFRDGYHGDTIGTMSLGSPNVFNEAYRDLLFDVYFIDPPQHGAEATSLSQLRELLDRFEDIAAFIYEPLVQAAGGMLMYSGSGLNSLISLCKEKQVFCIADEILTGFYRTGSMFASDQIDEKPDIICLSKALTGGALPLGVTIAHERIFQGFWSDERKHLFWHGHSFTANALACTAALKSIELYETQAVLDSVEAIQSNHETFAKRLNAHAIAENVRVCGVILAFDVRTDESTSYTNSIRDTLYRFFIDHGVLLRPLGNTVYILPPYCITQEQLQEVYDVVVAALDHLVESNKQLSWIK